MDAGDKYLKYYDPNDAHPYDKLDVTKGADGKVTAAQVTLDPNVLAAGMSIGQIFGSALGGALGGNSLVGNLAGSTIGGLIGSRFVQVLATAMTTDLSTVSVNDLFAGQGVSVANAGIGAVSSFLTAELGHALHIDGFDGQLFNTAVSSFTTSLLTQVTDKMTRGGLDFAGAIAAMDWSQAVSGAIDVAQINLGNLLGSYLGHELVPAQTREGAIGGQVFGAIGGFILGPVGSLIGTIIGTLIFNQFGTQPSPGAVDLLEQAGYLYGHREYQTSPDGGSYDISNKMAQAADDIINAYLHAVNGAALDHSKQATIGYIKNPDLLFISGVPGHTDRSFTSADDAVHAAALDVLQHTEVIGGDLLMKRAHQNSLSNVPETGGGGLPGQSQVSGADQLATMAGDISVAQDYENYLNNREAINALIAANPNSAFAAGWIATFARVNDLGLNHMGASDFLGGLVGYLDSVNKAGLGAEAANATVKRGSDNSVIVEVKVGNGVEVPGSLSVFADRMTVTSDASGQTLQFTVNSGLGASGTLLLGPGASGTGGHDIMVGGAGNDTFHGGAGFDFIDGGAGNDTLYGDDGNDILRGGRGNDYLFGGQGDDTYVFNRGDGADVVLDDVTTTTSVWQDEWRDDDGDGVNELHHDLVTKTDHPNAGTDSLVFGPGIARSDIVVQRSGNDLIVGVKDPAHPGAVNDQITLQRWFDADGFDRIEKFVFADGTTLNLSAGQAAIDARQVPFGETLSRSSVVEKSPIGTVVGTVTGFDFAPNATLTYSMVDSAGSRFAINASTGELTVAGAINYDDAPSLQVTVRVSDGAHVFDQPFTINVIDIPNRAPAVSLLAGANVVANAGQSLQASSLFSATDADGDALSYVIYDNTISAGAGHFMLNGAAVPSDTGVSLTAAQFAQLSFVAGAAGSVSDLNVRAYDGHAYSGWGEVHINVNRAPQVSLLAGANVVANAGQVMQVSGLFSATDADGDALSYVIYDNTISAGAGHFMLNGAAVPSDTGVSLSAAELAQLSFVAGAAGSSSDLNVRAYDGHVYSGWGEVHVNVNRAPQVSLLAGANVVANAGQVMQVSGLFSATDADGDALSYVIYDNTISAGAGHFMLNGAAVPSDTGVSLSAAGLAQLSFVAGAAGSVSDLNVRAYDGHVYSGWGEVHVNVNHAPVLTVPAAAITANPGQVLQASSLFSASDADGDALTFYFEDDTAAANSGYFMLNGTPQAQGAGFGVNAAQLATVTFVTGSADDDVSMQLADDKGAVSAAVGFHLHVNHAPAVGLLDSSALVANSGQVMQASSLFHATDADGDPLSYLIYDNTISSGGGHFMLNGAAVQSDIGVSLTAAQFAQLTFVAGAAESSSDLNVKAYDGRIYSDWGEIHIAVAPAGGTLVNNSSGTSTLTIADSADNHSWASFASTFSQPDGHGSLLSQTGVNDGGSTWWNVFDTSNAWSFNHYTSVFTPSGQLVTQTVTNDDGTHYLLANDPSNAYGWSTFTMTFDSGWNITSIVDVTNDDGTHTVDTGQILASLDTLTWYSNSYVVTLDKAVNPQGDGMPVILDLDGNGIDIAPLNLSTASFDMDGEAGREHTAWAGGKDGFLAIDLGADGKSGPDGVIDQAAEIVFTQWSPIAVSDMAALRDVFDTNRSGSLDPGDARWGEFRIWQDANADGVSQAGEVKTLDALGISTIGLNPTGPSKSFSDGSAIQGLSSFTRTDGTTGAAGDVSLAYQHGIADTPGMMGHVHTDWSEFHILV
jgi:hypothetical protein